MSVVAVKKTEKKIKIAADSIIIYGASQVEKTMKHSKLIEINGMTIGSVGYCYESALLENYCTTHQPNRATEREVINFFIGFNKYLEELGISKFTNDYLFIYNKTIFYVGAPMLVREVEDFCAIGAGQVEANTALYLGHSPAKAVEVACTLNCFVCSPVIEKEIQL